MAEQSKLCAPAMRECLCDASVIRVPAVFTYIIQSPAVITSWTRVWVHLPRSPCAPVASTVITCLACGWDPLVNAIIATSASLSSPARHNRTGGLVGQFAARDTTHCRPALWRSRPPWTDTTEHIQEARACETPCNSNDGDRPRTTSDKLWTRASALAHRQKLRHGVRAC